MTTEDYVSYPLALALKKHGFDEPCHYGYSVKMRLEPELSFGDPKMVHSKAPKNYNDNRKGIAKGLEFCSAVPLWQAQKWLRNKKGVLLWVYPDSQPIDEEYSESELTGEWWWEIDGSVSEGSGDTYPSYESALSAGIAAALELIGEKGE